MIEFDSVRFSQALDRADWTAVLNARMTGIPWNRLVNKEGFQALHLAVLHGQPLIVENLLVWGAPTVQYTTKDGSRHSPLWDAVGRNLDEIARLLVNAGADIDAPYPSFGGETEPPLLVAASQRHLGLTTLALMAQGVNLRSLTSPERESMFEAWFQALGQAKPQAEEVLAELEASGWFPEAEETATLESLIQTAQDQFPATRTILQKLQAHWRERQGRPQRPPHGHSQKRVRS